MRGPIWEAVVQDRDVGDEDDYVPPVQPEKESDPDDDSDYADADDLEDMDEDYGEDFADDPEYPKNADWN